MMIEKMIVAGVMSGTSADGIDVALVRMSGPRGAANSSRRARAPHGMPKIELLGHVHFAYSSPVRRTVLGMMDANSASVAEIARLNFLLGGLYAEAVKRAEKKLGHKADLVGCHGQTVYHQGEAASFLGKRLAVTWQLGEASCIAARLNVPVVSDFRPADMAAGGKGAPLVPFLDYLLYRDAKIGRIALNIGGIANLTAIPARAALDQVFAFDTGPGNMVVDALTEKLFGRPYDRGGKIAARGRVRESIVADYLRRPYFRRQPPKTAGREQFGREFAQEFYQVCANSRVPHTKGSEKHADVTATATALTVHSITDAIDKFVLPRGKFSELIVSGGGTNNRAVMSWLENAVHPLGLRLRSSHEFGIPSEAKEAAAFAVLAFETWNRRPSNVPSATGANHAAVLGKIAYP